MVFDPFDLTRKVTELCEKLVSELLDKRLHDPEVMKWLQRSMDLSAQVRQTLETQLQEVLRTAHMPTKTDIDALGARLASLEEKLSRLEEACRAQAEAAKAATAPPRRARAARPKRSARRR